MTARHPFIDGLRPLLEAVRTDVTAVKRPGQKFSSWTREPLTAANLADHFNGHCARGCSQIKAGESTTRVALLDLDSHGGETDWPGMSAVSQLVIAAARQRSIHLHPFRSSGGNGLHLYALWETPQDAHSVRETLAATLASVGYESGTGGVAKREIEVFPKQDSVPADGFGNMAILPGFNRSAVLDDMLRPLPREAFATLAWHWSDPVPTLTKPEPSQHNRAGLASIETVKSVLTYIDPRKLDYSGWRDIVFAVHAGTGGSEEGLAAALEWTQRNTEAYERDPTHLQDRVWPYIKQRDDGISFGWALKQARPHGYTDPATTTGFEFTPAPPPAPPNPFTSASAPAPAGDDDLLGFGPADIAQVSSLPMDDLGFGLAPAPQSALIPHSETPVEKAGSFFGRYVVSQVIPGQIPDFDRHSKTNKILGTIRNMSLALASPAFIQHEIAYDNFKAETVLRERGSAKWRPLTDADYVMLRAICEMQDFEQTPGKEVMRDVCDAVAHNNEIDTAIEWIESLEWDGVPRVENMMSTYFKAEPTAYTRAVGRYLATAMAGRTLTPGVKADMVVVLCGGQGAGKTTAVEALAPSPDRFAELSFDERDEDAIRKMRGIQVAEISEMRGVMTRDRESIKAFITRREEKWVPKYKEFATTFWRRFVFIGTTNQEEFLGDDTGERRWLPVDVGDQLDVEALRRDANQVWAEAAVLYKEHGVIWREAMERAKEVHAKYKVHDPWADTVARWLRTVDVSSSRVPGDAEFLSSVDILTGALGFEPRHVKRQEEMRLAQVMPGLGYRKARKQVAGSRTSGWERVAAAIPATPVPDLPF